MSEARQTAERIAGIFYPTDDFVRTSLYQHILEPLEAKEREIERLNGLLLEAELTKTAVITERDTYTAQLDKAKQEIERLTREVGRLDTLRSELVVLVAKYQAQLNEAVRLLDEANCTLHYSPITAFLSHVKGGKV